MNAFGPGTSLAHAFFHFVLLKSTKERPAAFTRFPWDTTWGFKFYFPFADRRFSNSNDRVFCFLCLKY